MGSELSETKQALLEKYLRGEIGQKNGGSASQQKQADPAPESSSAVSVLPVQSGGSKRPFFYLHVDYEHGPFYCFSLARALGADQPFYVLDLYPFDDLSVPPSLEAIVAAYVASVRTVQPQGPYLLGGFCGGALLALEIARQLRQEGENVDLLLLLEPGIGPLLMTISGKFLHRFGEMIRLRPDQQMDVFLRIRHAYRFLFRPVYRKQQSLLPAAAILRKDWIGVFVWIFSATKRPLLYPGRAIYFWAQDDSYRRKAWPRIAEAQEAEAFFIPGIHFSLVTDRLDVVSEQIKACIEKATSPS